MDLKSLFKRKDESIDRAVEKLLAHMDTLDPNSAEYLTAVTNLKTLYESRSYKSESSIGRETWLLVGANILGIVIVIAWEQTAIIAKNAFSMILKNKL
jgi:hypothetical protein